MLSGGLPTSGAVGASVGVLLYSFISLILCLLLVFLLISFGERWTYVTLFSGFTALSTTASIIQQLHYATDWPAIKLAQYNKAIESLTDHALAFGGSAHPVDSVLFYIQFYSYNVMALNILFWTVALFTGSWNIRSKWLGEYIEWVGPVVKTTSVILPALIIGLVNTDAVRDSPAGFVIVSYIAMFASLSMGSILLILILFKYIKTRRLVAGHGKRSRWWVGSSDRSQQDSSANYTADTLASGSHGIASATRRSIYDRALLIRFTVGFVIMAGFEIAIIFFTLVSTQSSAKLAAAGKPDYSVASAISDIVFFMPGVSASMVAFLVFGTTKSWRQYRNLVFGGCGLSKCFVNVRKRARSPNHNNQIEGGLEFQRLPSLHTRPSEERRQRGQEAEKRVRMFSITKETTVESDSSSDVVSMDDEISVAPPVSTKTSLGRVRAASETRTVQFNRPRPAVIRPARAVSPADLGLPNMERIDPVIQYDRQDWGQQESERALQRFVGQRLPRAKGDFIESDSSQDHV